MANIEYQNPASPTAILDSNVMSGSGSSEVRREVVNIGAAPTLTAGVLQPTANGEAPTVLSAVGTTQRTTSVAINFSSSGANTVIAGVLGETIRIWKMFLVVASTTNLTIKDSTPTTFSGAMTVFTGGDLTWDFDSEPWIVTGSGKDFVINSSNAVQVSGIAYYTQS